MQRPNVTIRVSNPDDPTRPDGITSSLVFSDDEIATLRTLIAVAKSRRLLLTPKESGPYAKILYAQSGKLVCGDELCPCQSSATGHSRNHDAGVLPSPTAAPTA